MSTTTPVSAVPLRLLTTLKCWANALPMSPGIRAGLPVHARLTVSRAQIRAQDRPADQVMSRDPEVRLGPNGPDLGNLERAYVIAPDTYSM